ncbi:AsnC family transcriptional regulator protein [Marine Group I thaumarchaeote SCGC AAA799-E16]|uniref:AsnC family transcriptional regulator protein n=3 Tax=Marine Group I TaxID=905826 RepID=A0A081RLJ6_9ARCH|nr:AsnC family transcriptional regulator protein [Marine Group I thaumarchaeote SCGC AAA799-N04]KER05863.1 AsnC family transcriptional regulator protein [Marine Group I thaumarchaeote SCGC AAA799-E16]KFM16571.1 AsnC family transcriptional regulator protein [Marine Group I thaumarchaeote SCGC RSA3]
MKRAYVLINCNLGTEKEILETLRSIKSVKEAHGTFGAYDIIVEVIADSMDKLREEITWKIRKIPYIRATLTLTGIGGQN